MPNQIPHSPRWVRGAGAGIIAASAFAAYHGILSSPFVFLDLPAIPDNATLRRLWPIWKALHPPSDRGVTVEGRPVLNFSLACNYAISGTAVWSYHVVNLLIHILAAWALWGVARRTLKRIGFPDGGPLAFAIALLWAVHPLQTESVTYMVQRAESMMGMFYLLTLYCFIRHVEGDGGRAGSSFAEASADGPMPPLARALSAEALAKAGWAGLSMLFCLLGMGTKEVMVSAPVMVLFYDRIFISGSFRAAWRERWKLYLALAATWLPLLWLVAATGGNRGGTAGFGLAVSFGDYLRTQFPAVIHYLRLALWPQPLVFYYEVKWVGVAQAAPYALLVLALAASTLAALCRRSGWGFLGAFFFAVLAPTSLVPGMSQTLAEHRMYLPLAAVIAAIVIGVRNLVGKSASVRRGLFAALVSVAVGLGCLTALRNRVYRSETALWSDTVAKAAGSPFVQNNLGIALAGAGRFSDAIGHLSRAVELKPDYASAWDNLGLALAGAGRLAEAISRYEQALRLQPNSAEASANLGVALAEAGRLPEAIARLRRAVELDPGYVAARNDLAVALAESGRREEAIAQYEEVLRREPENSEAHYNLGNALTETNRWAEAITHYQSAVRLKPDYPEAWANFGAALARSGHLSEAVAVYERALSVAPNDPDVHYNLALALRDLGRNAEAEMHFATASRLRAGH